MNALGSNDRALIESLQFDASLEPSFDVVKSCLWWDDERPFGLTRAGYRFICDLWIMRSFFHQGLPEHEWGLNPDHYKRTWGSALAANLHWPGFERIELSARDRAFLEKCLRETAFAEDY